MSTITDGVGLNITVHSYANRMDFGLISDRQLIPDLWHLVDLHIAEVERLFEATGAEWAVPQPPPPMRHGGDGVTPIKRSGSEGKEGVAAKRAVSKPQTGVPKRAAVKKAAVALAAAGIIRNIRQLGRHTFYRRRRSVYLKVSQRYNSQHGDGLGVAG